MIDDIGVLLVLGMRLDGEIDNEEERGNTKEMNLVSNSDSSLINLGFSQQIVVGYALTTKKKQSFLQPKLELVARYIVCTFFKFLDFLSFFNYWFLILCQIDTSFFLLPQ